MPILPGVPGNVGTPPGPITFQALCTMAMKEINVIAPGELPDPQELQDVADVGNLLFDSWNAQRAMIYAVQLLTFAWSGAGNPQTIGPAGSGPNGANPNFVITGSRPVRIKNANWILTATSPVVRYPLEERDSDWWATQRVQTIPGIVPTDYYYRPDSPAGSFFLWPVPNVNGSVEFEIETIFQGAAILTTQFNMPPGYDLAYRLTLAELICSMFEKQPTPTLVGSALLARQAVRGLNAMPPRINLDDFGHSGKALPTFNYRTGSLTH